MTVNVIAKPDVPREAVEVLGPHLSPARVARLLAAWQVGGGNYLHRGPEAAGGQTGREPLGVACHACHACKGSRGEAQDPLTGARVPLFHPRLQVWRAHGWGSEAGKTIVGLTPLGRARVAALYLQHPASVEARRRGARVGWPPPPDDR